MFFLQRKLYFPRIKRGSNIFQGGGGDANFNRNPHNHITCYFTGWGVRTPYPLSGSAHVSFSLQCNEYGKCCQRAVSQYSVHSVAIYLTLFSFYLKVLQPLMATAMGM